ncbi:endonuclease/exonuclease/phosphatase family protein [Myxococcus sp. AB025B]|uniref:endonuclease/exonuclease/phosphatase family protein n=1 Tax=Myxococcus sp. AB025B TaxID=2562794 RepID=UPI001890BADC|nr:endonuclease/exonuclease/phosphatase family protein [Myxococcus sp. AB025B]
MSGGANEGPSGYSKPVHADELPDLQNGTGGLTLNLANGAGSEYRTAKNREEQAELIRETGATIAGFQEVDIGVDRSGNANTALDIARRVVGPDGQEKSIINVHLAAGKEGAGLREKQLQFLAEVARAEAKGPPARELVVMGDFNDSTENVGKALEGAGLHRVVGGKKANGDNFDQVWVSGGLDTHNAAQVKTDGVSDHAHAGYPIIR